MQDSDREETAPKKAAKKKRHQISLACRACRAAKTKCTEARPCTRCIKMKLEATCVAEQATRRRKRRVGSTAGPADKVSDGGEGAQAAVLPGIPFVLNGSKCDTSASFLPDDHAWFKGPIRRAYELGYDSKSLAQMFASLPPALAQVMRDACQAMEVLDLDKQRLRSWFDGPVVGSQPMLSKNQDHGTASTQCSVEEAMDNALWDEHGDAPLLRITFFKDGSRRSAHVSKHWESMMQIEQTQLLERIEKHELQLPMPELEYIAVLVDDISKAFKPFVTRVERFRWPNGHFGLVQFLLEIISAACTRTHTQAHTYTKVCALVHTHRSAHAHTHTHTHTRCGTCSALCMTTMERQRAPSIFTTRSRLHSLTLRSHSHRTITSGR